MFSLWNSIIDLILPFEWSKFSFMKNALLAIILIAPLFGILGTMVVNNRMAFFSDSLGHGAFTGIAIGAILGISQPIWSAILFSVIFAITITIIKNRSKASTDTIIGVFSSTAVALGLVILSYGGSFNKFSSFLIGDLLSINESEIKLLFILFIAIIILWLFIFNKILIISINQSFAMSRGINAMFSEIIFTCSIAIVVTVTIQWVGLLIINSLIVLPAAASRNISRNVRQYHFFSVVFSLVSCIIGLISSYYLESSTGATIVLVSSIIFFITYFIKDIFHIN